MRVLDLMSNERPTLRIILPPDKATIDVFTPTKALRDLFPFLGESLQKVGNSTATDDDLDRLYDITAQILSRNMQCITFTQTDLENRLDTREVTQILNAYLNFLRETVNSKN